MSLAMFWSSDAATAGVAAVRKRAASASMPRVHGLEVGGDRSFRATSSCRRAQDLLAGGHQLAAARCARGSARPRTATPRGRPPHGEPDLIRSLATGEIAEHGLAALRGWAARPPAARRLSAGGGLAGRGGRRGRGRRARRGGGRRPRPGGAGPSQAARMRNCSFSRPRVTGDENSTRSSRGEFSSTGMSALAAPPGRSPPPPWGRARSC